MFRLQELLSCEERNLGCYQSYNDSFDAARNRLNILQEQLVCFSHFEGGQDKISSRKEQIHVG